jgi:signal transduction histidine kinase
MKLRKEHLEILRDKKILIVDDIPENLKVLGTLLRKTGVDISIAVNGEKGVEIAKTIVPDLILMDVNMPVLTGYDACKLIKEDPDICDIPLIFLTARDDRDDMINGYNLGAIDYITKPFNHTELIMKLVNYLTLRQRSVELEESNRQLKAADAAKNKFVSIISHDLRSPMGGILGLTRILNEDADSLTKEEREEFTSSIYQTLRRQYNFMEDLLKWGNMQIGRYELKPDEIDLTMFIENIKELYSSNIMNKEIDFIVDIEKGLAINVDTTMFNSALTNIVSNCIKFTPQKGVISIKANSDDTDNVHISLKDSGVGMEQVIADHIFDPEHFHTTKGTEMEGGSGLGMVLVGDVIRIHNGSIKAISHPGNGTEFRLIIPKKVNIEPSYN